MTRYGQNLRLFSHKLNLSLNMLSPIITDINGLVTFTRCSFVGDKHKEKN